MTEEQKTFVEYLDTLETYKPDIRKASLEKMKEMLTWNIQEIDRRLASLAGEAANGNLKP